MRKIILMMSVSLDGFFEGPDHELDWKIVDDELHSHFNEQLAAMGGFLDGRITYQLMAGFWPTADTDPSSTAPMVVRPDLASDAEDGVLPDPDDGGLEHHGRERARRRGHPGAQGAARGRPGSGVVLLRYQRPDR